MSDAASQQVRLSSDVQRRIIVGRLNPIDVRNSHKRDLSCALDREPILLTRRALAIGNAVLHAAEHQRESAIVERLEQVIQRAGFERL